MEESVDGLRAGLQDRKVCRNVHFMEESVGLFARSAVPAARSTDAPASSLGAPVAVHDDYR